MVPERKSRVVLDMLWKKDFDTSRGVGTALETGFEKNQYRFVLQ